MWLSLETLRELPLAADARCRLLQSLALEGGQGVGPLASALDLQLEAAEATAISSLDCLDRSEWLQAIERHNELHTLLGALVQNNPNLAGPLWSRYGELLAGLTAAVHGVVNTNSPSPPEPGLRATLCWRLMELLEEGHRLPFEPPDWLAVLEQQLVQDGALFWRERIGTTPEALERALGLFLRLGQLLEPLPEWVDQACRTLLVDWLNPRLAGPEPPLEPVPQLLDWLERWPVAGDRRGALAEAVARTRITLNLLEHMPAEAEPTPQAEPPSQAAPAAPLPQAEEGPQPDHQSAGPLQLVIQPDGSDPVSPQALNLAPLLTCDLESLEQELERFVQTQPPDRPAAEAISSMLTSLATLWRNGGRLPLGSFPLLSYTAAAWQRRLGARIAPLPPLALEAPLQLELNGQELALLQAVLMADPALEPALVELRRQHHNGDFWRAQEARPWYARPSPLEALRRLHLEAGLYLSGHAPMESLKRWAQGVVAALLAGQVWSDDPATLGLWLPVAQQLMAKGSSVPTFGRGMEPQTLLAALAGQEVVYVGDHGERLQATHRHGVLFRPEPFGLRCLAPPASRHPLRPSTGYEASLESCLEAVEALHQKRPFQWLLSDAGAYRLGLAQAAHSRLGVRCVCTATPLVDWLEERG